MSTLPQKWIITSFGTICGNGQYGWTTRASSQGFVRFLRTTDITKDQINWDSVPYCQEVPPDLEKYQIQTNDILISRSGSVGFSTLISKIPFPTVFASYLIRFSPSKYVDPRYLAYFLRSSEYWRQIAEVSSGIAISNVNAKKLSEIIIPLAPFNEQKQIADKLDTLLDRVDVCRDRLKNILSVLKNFRYSVLNAAISGELTNNWRLERNRSLDSWQEKNGREVFSFITSGSRGWSTYYSNHGSIFLRVGNLDHATIDLDLRQIQYVNPPVGAEGKRTRIELGDILISITADVGMVALIREDIGEAYINQHLCLARQTGEYLGAYLAYFLASPLGGFAQLTEMQRGVTKSGLTLGDIRSVKFVIPDLDEQHEIVNRIESLFSYANYCDLNYQKAYAILENLTPIILDKAFRGELVPQDPNDEPAAILLDRIHAERIANPSTLKRDLITRKPKMTKMTNESVKKIIDELPSDG